MVWTKRSRFCAVALQSVQSGYARIPVTLDDSARVLGTGGAALLARVHWPLVDTKGCLNCHEAHASRQKKLLNVPEGDPASRALGELGGELAVRQFEMALRLDR